MLRDGHGQPLVRVEVAVRPLAVQVGQGRVVRARARDQHVVDRRWQAAEEPVKGGRVCGVEGRGADSAGLGRGADGAELGRGPLNAARVAAGQDHHGALVAGPAGCLEADACAAADHHNGLAEQLGSASGRRGG